ncbi:MAG: YfjI family protein [Mangrovicoccus sp.]
MTEYSDRDWVGYSQTEIPFELTPESQSVDCYPKPIPLMRQRQESAEFPIEALGSLAQAVDAIAALTAAPRALAVQSILGAVSLATQGLVDIEIHNSQKPISLFLLSVAESGERKSGCDQLALKGVREFEEKLDSDYRQARRDYENERDLYESERTAILRRKGDLAERRADLESLTVPKAPLLPQLLLTDPTIEGLFKHFDHSRPSLGIFSDEGGQFLGGYAMNAENKLKTGSTICNVWGGVPVNRTRAGMDQSITYRGRRVSCHLMTQPLIAEEFLGDELLRSQGLLSRMLIAWPESTIGTRLIAQDRKMDEEEKHKENLAQFHRRVSQLLEASFEEDRSELDLRALPLSKLAEQVHVHFFNTVEAGQKPGERYENITGFASKIAEQAVRLAAILQIFEDETAEEISGPHMANGITLAEWYLHEALRLFDTAAVPEILYKAETLRKWVQCRWGEPFIDVRTIVNRGPNSIRSTDLVRRLIAILEANYWLSPHEGPQFVNGAMARNCWRIARE